MAGLTLPFAAYDGDDDYVFVSYAHQNARDVYRELEWLRGSGLNIWYDEGISPGSRWSEELATRIENCAVFLLFVTPESVRSEHCLNEIEFAQARQRNMLVVHLSETDLPSGLELSLGGTQAIFKFRHDESAYRAKVMTALTKMRSGRIPRQPPRRGSASSRNLWVAVGAIVLLVGGAFVLRFQRPSDEIPTDPLQRPAVAVLPFEVQTGDSERAFLGDALADDLTTRLAGWRAFPVIAHASASDRELPNDPRGVGRALGARYLVDGRLRDTDSGFRLAVELIDAETGAIVWNEQYERAADEAIPLQEEIGTQIVASLTPAVIRQEGQRALRADPEEPSAWTAAMRGWWLVNRETSDGVVESRPWFNDAIARDPAWGWPHAALALTHYRELINGWTSSYQPAIAALVKEAETAVALDPMDAFAHHALGHAYAMTGRVPESLDALARGVELNPSDAMANGCYAMQLAASNHPADAIRHVEYAMRISPKDPWLHRFAIVMARAYFAAGDYAQSETWAVRSQQLRPSMPALWHSVAAAALGGRIEVAQARTQQAAAQGQLPPLSVVERNLSRSTDAGYVARLIEGLRLGGFEA